MSPMYRFSLLLPFYITASIQSAEIPKDLLTEIPYSVFDNGREVHKSIMIHLSEEGDSETKLRLVDMLQPIVHTIYTTKEIEVSSLSIKLPSGDQNSFACAYLHDTNQTSYSLSLFNKHDNMLTHGNFKFEIDPPAIILNKPLPKNEYHIKLIVNSPMNINEIIKQNEINFSIPFNRAFNIEAHNKNLEKEALLRLGKKVENTLIDHEGEQFWYQKNMPTLFAGVIALICFLGYYRKPIRAMITGKSS